MKYLIPIALCLMLLVACGGNTDSGADSGNDQLPDFDADKEAQKKADNPSAADKAAEKLKDLFGSGMSIKCSYTVKDQGVDMHVVSWTNADATRVEQKMTVNGETHDSVVIAKEDGAYMQGGAGMADNPIMEDCDWIFYADAGEAGTQEPPDFDEDYTLEEAMAAMQGMYADFDCSPAKAPAGAFEPKGEVCDMQQMMEDMMNQMGDPNNFDPSMYGIEQ